MEQLILFSLQVEALTLYIKYVHCLHSHMTKYKTLKISELGYKCQCLQATSLKCGGERLFQKHFTEFDEIICTLFLIKQLRSIRIFGEIVERARNQDEYIL